MIHKLKNIGLAAAMLFSTVSFFSSCGNTTPEDVDYLFDFHTQYAPTYDHPLVPDSVDLYVDYTTGLALKGRIKFYWEVLKSTLAEKVKNYYAIKGQQISHEAGDVEELLKGVRNYENPDLKGALKRIVNGNVEAVLITDGELADPSDPFMKEAFKTWLMKGHDVFIMSEAYYEGGKTGAKKNMFYFLFYDAKVDKNLCEYVKKRAKLSHYPKIKKLNLSITPSVSGSHGGHSDPNSYVQAMVTRKGDMEIQEWSTEWADKIEKFIINAKDSWGEPMENGAVLVDGLQLDRNSIAGMRITSVKTKVYNINSEYADYYEKRRAEEPVDSVIEPDEVENFLIFNEKAFERNSFMQLFFDKKHFDDSCLNGQPFNYFKICFYITGLEENLERYRAQLEFDDIYKKGYKNVSVFESVKQTIEDKDFSEFLASNPIYTIYVKALPK